MLGQTRSPQEQRFRPGSGPTMSPLLYADRLSCLCEARSDEVGGTVTSDPGALHILGVTCRAQRRPGGPMSKELAKPMRRPVAPDARWHHQGSAGTPQLGAP